MKGAEGRRSRVETRSITFSSTCTVSRTEFPLRTASALLLKKEAAGAGAPGKAGPTRQSPGLAGKQDPSIVRQCASILV